MITDHVAKEQHTREGCQPYLPNEFGPIPMWTTLASGRSWQNIPQVNSIHCLDEREGQAHIMHARRA